MSYLSSLVSSLANVEVNCGPLSEIWVSWRPKHLNTFSRKSFSTPATSMIFKQGIMITPFIGPWSTMTIKESNPLEGGRSVMGLTESCLNGRVVVEGIGIRGGQVGWVFTLFC